jgi:hypothetical protein
MVVGLEKKDASSFMLFISLKGVAVRTGESAQIEGNTSGMNTHTIQKAGSNSYK